MKEIWCQQTDVQTDIVCAKTMHIAIIHLFIICCWYAFVARCFWDERRFFLAISVDKAASIVRPSHPYHIKTCWQLLVQRKLCVE